MKRTFSLLLITLFIFSAAADAQSKRIMTFAGSGGTGAYSGDGYAATGARLNGPQSVALDNMGNTYFVDYYNYVVRKVKVDGTIVTFAGDTVSGFSGMGSAATSANLDPTGVAADFRGNVYISCAVHGVICKVNRLGIISVYAGTGSYGYTGDGGQATSARLTAPMGLATDKRGNLYVADAGNHTIRKIDTFGVITTIAGSGVAGYTGDGFGATLATLDSPFAVALDKSDELYIADRSNNVVRFVDYTGTIYTIAGTGTRGYTGDGRQAISATLYYPSGVAVDTSNFVYISDSYNNVVRVVDTLGFINTFAGDGFPGFGGDLGAPNGANLFHPYGIASDTFGNIFIADANNQRVRKVYVYNPAEGINQTTLNASIQAYPNPVDDKITISGLEAADKVCIYDLAGRAVTPTWTVTNSGEQSYSIGALATGMYLLQVTDNNGSKKAVIRLTK